MLAKEVNRYFADLPELLKEVVVSLVLNSTPCSRRSITIAENIKSAEYFAFYVKQLILFNHLWFIELDSSNSCSWRIKISFRQQSTAKCSVSLKTFVLSFRTLRSS